MKKSPAPADLHVGARVRMRRKMLGLSQIKLADKIGVTFQQVQKYENGRNRIGASRLQQIADALKVPPEFFFQTFPGAQSGGAPSQDFIMAFITTTDGIVIARAFSQIRSPKLKRAIAHMIEQVAETAAAGKGRKET